MLFRSPPAPEVVDVPHEFVHSTPPVPPPNERYVAPIYTSTIPSPLSMSERGVCEPYVFIPEPGPQVRTQEVQPSKRKESGRESALRVTNTLEREFQVFVQRKETIASWTLSQDETQGVILLGDHHAKVDTAPVGLACCIASAAIVIHPQLPEVQTLQVEFLPEQLGLHIQHAEHEQAVMSRVDG